jgi:pilus assembly protein CpaE
LKPGEDDWDVALLELDSDPELCLAVVQSISGKRPDATVMVYTTKDDSELLMRSMWAGAREFLTLPLTERAVTEAFLRAATRLNGREGARGTGKVLVFVGAKGGAGVTTIATNFALALRKEATVETALLDLDLELGDMSVLLGITPRHTLRDVVENSKRLDRDLLMGMLSKHESGLAVMAGPDEYAGPAAFENGDLTKLLYLLREQFPYVVVDTGPNLGRSTELLYELAECIYVVTQADVPSLRNAQRYVSHMQRFGAGKVKLVINRYDPRKHEIDEERIAKAVGVPVDWKIPNDYAGVKRSHNTAAPLALGESPVSRVLVQMARAAAGKPSENGSKRMRGLFG